MSDLYVKRESITGTDSVLSWMRKKDRYAGLTLDQRLTLNALTAWAARTRKEAEYFNARLVATGDARGDEYVHAVWEVGCRLCTDMSLRLESLSQDIERITPESR